MYVLAFSEEWEYNNALRRIVVFVFTLDLTNALNFRMKVDAICHMSFFLGILKLTIGQENDTDLIEPNLSVCSSMNYRALSHSMQNEHQCLLLSKILRDLEDERQHRESMINDIVTQLDAVNEKLNQLNVHVTKSQTVNEAEQILSYSPMFPNIPLIRECNELNINGIHKSGVYPIKLPNQRILNVWCDMATDRGGWTVIQRRQDGHVNFTRDWNDYAFGFGNPNSEYWLGNEYLHELTSRNNFSLRIDFWDWEGDHAFAEYKFFFINNEADKYRISVSGFRGDAGDSITGYHNNMQFSTIDNDNDLWQHSCAENYKGGWWYRECGFSALNGLYWENGTIPLHRAESIRGILWYSWKSRYIYSLKAVEMKIKPTVAIEIERELLQELERVANSRNGTSDTGQRHNGEDQQPIVN